MPNRMLRDWTRSDKVNVLTVHAERFFTRLIMKVDDYGCFFADARLLKADLYPLMLDGVREADISRWTAECAKAGLIVLYEADSKRYLMIQEFRQRLDKARNKYPLPNSTDFPEIVNEFPAEVELEVEVEKEKNTGAPSAPRGSKKGNRVGTKKFILPTLPDVVGFFLSTVGAPDHPRHWPEDKCRNQGALLFDHYKANGWVQGRGKPIKDWQAACRNWIRHEWAGDFKPPEPVKRDHPPATRRPEATSRDLTPLQSEINAMYDLWLEKPENVTVISATADHYNLLKSSRMIMFSDAEISAIQTLAHAHMKEKGLEGPIAETRLLKAFGVLEFFKQLKTQAKEAVFTL